MMHRNKGSQGVKTFSRLEGVGSSESQGYCGMACIGHRDGRRDETRNWFNMADGKSHVFGPDIDDRRTAAVIARIHAQVVCLTESRMQREHPVRPLLIRAALIRPKRGSDLWHQCAQPVLAVGPATDDERRGSLILVLDFEDSDRGEIIVESNGDLFAHRTRITGQQESLPCPEGV